MTVGITGGKGFIGSHLVPELRSRGYQCELFEEYGVQIEDSGLLKRFVKNKDLIIHLAGKNKGSTDELFKTNVLGTQMLLSAVQEVSPKAKIIFASTVQVYLKDSFYGFSKKQAESVLGFYASKYAIPSIVLRFTNIYGSGGKPFYNSVIATFVHQLKNGKQLTINGDGTDKRDYLFVDDAVRVVINAVNTSFSNSFMIFDVCSGKKYSLLQIVRMLKKNWPDTIKVDVNTMNSEYWKFRVNNRRTRQMLSWSPRVSLEEGLVRLLNNEN